ncbi:MAG: ATP-binding protein [Rhodospirillaceae bacterium]|nr:ATP-binding protein [Rhodospirillaceae bacterium]
MPDDSARLAPAAPPAPAPTPAPLPLVDKDRINLERYLPRTLKARASLIIVVPLILVQIISTFIFYDNHWDTLSRRMAASLAGDIGAIAAFVHDYPGAENRAWIVESARQSLDLGIAIEDGATLGAGAIAGDGPFGDPLAEALWSELKRPFSVNLATYRADKLIAIDVQLEGAVLRVLAPRTRLFSSTTYVFVIWMVGSSMLLFGVATVFLHNQVRSIRRLAQNVDAFGKGRDVPDIAPEGAFEVRQAARAFNIMRARIRRQIQQRTEMLAGVSHDLRTPLTRIKLQLGLSDRVEGDDLAALKDDVTEMERMLEAYLAFARGDGAEETVPTDLKALIETVVARFRREGAAISATAHGLPSTLPLKPVAFERCLGNLIGNAVRYGKTVAVSARRADMTILIEVDDDGPGVPAAKRDEVFRAFTRLEPSRNPKTGGVGLGLTIARDIALGLGGDIVLSDSPLGGLRATIKLPV